MKILDMSEAQRPREKLLHLGPQALGDAELLAILLRTGHPGESALDMANRLLSLVGGRLSGLVECDRGYLTGMAGVGPSRAAAMLAAFELGRRFFMEQSDPGDVLTEPEQVFRKMLPRLKGLRHEECWLILLDNKVRELSTVRMTVGGSKSTTIDIAQIVRKAIEGGAANLILVHNHPKGDPRPSRGDIKETANLRDACTACNLRLLDHIIVADEHFYSFNSEKIY